MGLGAVRQTHRPSLKNFRFLRDSEGATNPAVAGQLASKVLLRLNALSYSA
jgi:hypothetical protein